MLTLRCKNTKKFKNIKNYLHFASDLAIKKTFCTFAADFKTHTGMSATTKKDYEGGSRGAHRDTNNHWCCAWIAVV